MAETLGLAANLAAVIGAGLGLSKFLYDFASVLGSASYDAIESAQDVIDRCHVIFHDLDETIKKLQKGQYQLNLVTRAKWFFKEKRVLLIHEQLKTCGATLNLMLTTLLLAQKIATRRNSSIATQNEDEDVQDRLVTHSLFMAQQAATERLAIAEEEDRLAEEQTEVNGPSSPQSLSPGGEGSSSASQRRHRRIPSDRATAPTQANDSIDRLSTILSRSFNRLSVVSSTDASFQNENRLSILQTNELLQHWTDQSDPLAASIRESSLDLAHAAHNDSQLSDMRAMEGNPTAGPESSYKDSPNAGIEIFKSFRIGLEDPTYKVLPAALRKYNINADWQHYALYITFRDQERCFGLQEKPLLIFREYNKEGKKPLFVLRKLAQSPSVEQFRAEGNFI